MYQIFWKKAIKNVLLVIIVVVSSYIAWEAFEILFSFENSIFKTNSEMVKHIYKGHAFYEEAFEGLVVFVIVTLIVGIIWFRRQYIELRSIHTELEAANIQMAAGLRQVQEAEERLQEIVILNKKLLDAMPHPAMLIDSTRIVIAANKCAVEVGALVGGLCWQSFGACKSISGEHKECIEKNGLLSSLNIRCTFCEADKMLANDQARSKEILIDGRVYDTHWVPVENNLYLHYAVDITEYKKLQTKLEKTTERYQDLYNNAPSMFSSLDVRTKRIVRCNKALIEGLGYATKEEVVGMPIADLYAEDPEHLKNVIAKFQRDGELVDEEMHLRKKDGTIITTLLSSTAVRDAEGNVLYSRSIHRDITHEKEAAREQLEKERLSTAIKMSGAVCHEMSQPVQALNGYISLIKINPEKYTTVDQLEKMEEQTHRIGELLDKLHGIRYYKTKPYLKEEIIDIDASTDPHIIG